MQFWFYKRRKFSKTCDSFLCFNFDNDQNILVFIFISIAISNIEESIQRVNIPPPKRKTFEFQLENRKNSYQNSFLKYLAGEKQPTLDIIAEHITRKPKENLFNYNSLNKKYGLQKNVSDLAASTSVAATTTTTAASTTTTTTAISTNIDKENYYNSNKREPSVTTTASSTVSTNNTTLNGTNEYRNSYKDHYDHQGVRLNPAILKTLPTEHQQSFLQNQQHAQVRPPSNSSVIITPQQQPQSQQIDVNKINDVTQLLNYPQNGKIAWIIRRTHPLLHKIEHLSILHR